MTQTLLWETEKLSFVGGATFPREGVDSRYEALQAMQAVTSHPCCCCMKTAIGNMYMNRHGCVPIKLHLQNQEAVQIGLMGWSLPTPALYHYP